MVDLRALVTYTDQLLGVSEFSDYCPNGLQVEGRSQVQRLVAGVTACQALLDAAPSADAILVHHGLFALTCKGFYKKIKNLNESFRLRHACR